MVSSFSKKMGGERSLTTLVILVLCANALIVGLMEQYHEQMVSMSKGRQEAVLSDIKTKNEEVKNEIITLEGVATWEETLFASSTASP